MVAPCSSRTSPFGVFVRQVEIDPNDYLIRSLDINPEFGKKHMLGVAGYLRGSPIVISRHKHAGMSCLVSAR
ncbi:hypothetical protein GCM10010872_39460 [Dyella flava]|nr:hypothetical protein GCM10010872_39460 [Dyella flava]